MRKDAVPAHMGQCMKAYLYNARVPACMLDSLFTHPYVDSCVQKGFVPVGVDRTIFLSDRHIAFGKDMIFVRLFVDSIHINNTSGLLHAKI